MSAACWLGSIFTSYLLLSEFCFFMEVRNLGLGKAVGKEILLFMDWSRLEALDRGGLSAKLREL